MTSKQFTKCKMQDVWHCDTCQDPATHHSVDRRLRPAWQLSSIAQHALTIRSNEETPCSMHQNRMTASAVNGPGYDNSSLVCCTTCQCLQENLPCRSRSEPRRSTNSVLSQKQQQKLCSVCEVHLGHLPQLLGVTCCLCIRMYTNKLIPHS